MTGSFRDLVLHRHMLSRRAVWLTALVSAAVTSRAAKAAPATQVDRPLVVIEAPSNLGLRPLVEGKEPGAWRAPDAYRRVGLQAALRPRRTVSLPRPQYDFAPQPGTGLRNGRVLRAFSETLADEVERSLRAEEFPFVIGGDCSVMLGCLAGARRIGEIGLVHIDGHADFRHPGNYDAAHTPGSTAGMDLALATGRGEALMTEWDDRPGPLVPDARVVQIGEKWNSWPELRGTAITRLDRKWFARNGSGAAVKKARALLEPAGVGFWIHLDVDVLTSRLMPAVDSPAKPGMTFDEVAQLLDGLCRSPQCLGLDVAIFDPDLDPDQRYARALKRMLLHGLRSRLG